MYTGNLMLFTGWSINAVIYYWARETLYWTIINIFYFAIFQGCCKEVFFSMFRCITDIYSSKKIKFVSVIQTYHTVCVYHKSNTSLYNRMVKLQVCLWNVPSVGKWVSVPDIRHSKGFITQGGWFIMWLYFFCFII